MPKYDDRTRYLYFDEKNASGLRRRISVAYKIIGSDTIQYGASIHRAYDTEKHAFWRKADHRKTAEGRLEKCPITVRIYTDLHGGDTEFRKKLRRAIHLHGVKCKD
jgi:hypothetical protein